MMVGGCPGPPSAENDGLGTFPSPWEPEALGTEQCTCGPKCHSGSVLTIRYSQGPLPPSLTGTPLLGLCRAKERTGLIPSWLNKG